MLNKKVSKYWQNHYFMIDLQRLPDALTWHESNERVYWHKQPRRLFSNGKYKNYLFRGELTNYDFQEIEAQAHDSVR